LSYQSPSNWSLPNGKGNSRKFVGEKPIKIKKQTEILQCKAAH
jgi:hypothetical protein